MAKVRFNVPNISCHHCVNTIKRELKELPGVVEVKGDVQEKEIQVLYEKPADPNKIAELLKEIGYPGKEI